MKKLLLSLIILATAVLMFAQGGDSGASTTSSSAYMYEDRSSGEERLKMYVYILGRVQKPGLYLVPDDTDFLTLLALAGGPLEDARLSKIEITRNNAALRDASSTSGNTDDNEETVIPGDSSSRGEKITINFKKYLETGDNTWLRTVNTPDDGKPVTSDDLRLRKGDTVYVAGAIWYWFGWAAEKLSQAAIALSVYNLITNL